MQYQVTKVSHDWSNLACKHEALTPGEAIRGATGGICVNEVLLSNLVPELQTQEEFLSVTSAGERGQRLSQSHQAVAVSPPGYSGLTSNPGDLCMNARSRSTLCDPLHCSPPGSSVYGIL